MKFLLFPTMTTTRARTHRLALTFLFNQVVDNERHLTYVVFNRIVEQGAESVAADPLSRVFSALADPIRRDMVARLAAGDATVNQLAEPYDVTVQAVSKHLRVLEDAGLVSRTRDAQRRPVHLEAEVFDLMTKWIERYRRQAEERFRRLDDVLRDMPDEVAPNPLSAQGESR
jgi:DNA-binding transcriptional ArsR family regulator